MIVDSKILKSSAFVGIKLEKESGEPIIAPRGTCTFCVIPFEHDPKQGLGFIVTAQHVAMQLHQAGGGYIRLNRRRGKSEWLPLEVERWWDHPTDPAADVAVADWRPPSTIYDYTGNLTSNFYLNEENPGFRIAAGSDIFIMGLFAGTGLKDSPLMVPFLRSGQIAAYPAQTVGTKRGDTEVFLVEARSIGGLSGSPVGVSEDRFVGFRKQAFLGIVHGHWDVKVELDGRSGRSESELFNMGMAMVVPAKKILETLNRPELVEARNRDSIQYSRSHIEIPV